jgi:hypothetical protein
MQPELIQQWKKMLRALKLQLADAKKQDYEALK